MHAAKPDFARAVQPDRQEHRPALVERERVKTVLKSRFRKLEMVTDIGGCVSEIGETECRDHVPHTEEADLRVRLHDIVGAGPADAVALDFVAEIQRRRGAAAEADDVDDGIGGERRLEVAVRFVDLAAFAGAEQSAGKVAEK